MRAARPIVAALTLAAAWVSAAARAHDIPNARIERATQVTLAPGRLRVDYEVALAELTLAQDLRRLDGEGFAGDRAALFERYAHVVGPLNARGFLVQVDGADVELAMVDFAIVVEDHPRIRFALGADIPARGRLTLVDTNYESSEGGARLALEAAPGIAVAGDLPPARVESIPLRATWQLTDDEERRSRRLAVDYRPQSGAVAPPRPVVPPAIVPAPAPVRDPIAASGLTRLLDRPSGLVALGWVLAAVGLGMVHAIQPGHGKTLVAVASLDGPARGVALGLATAACHLASVAALALSLGAIPTTRFAAIHLVLVRASGAAIAAVGAFRVGRHLAGLDPAGDHPHGPRGRAGASTWSLGFAAGAVPCWDAIALVVLAQATGQLAWGLVLLAAFSFGLGLVLVAVGWAAGRLRRAWPANAGAGAVAARRWLGLASGLLLLAIGSWLLRS